MCSRAARRTRDDVAQPVVQRVGRQGAHEHAESVRQVAQERPFRLRDAVAADVGLEVARRLHHVAQHALGQKLIVAGPRHALAVQLEGAVQQIL